MKTLKLYVAGAWVEQHSRARVYIAKLRTAGIEITCDWTVAEGTSNASSDANLSGTDRLKFALDDLDGVLKADLVWLLAANDKGACGSWVELGAALAIKRVKHERPGTYPLTVVSGPKHKRTIFTEYADKLFATDDGALEWIVQYARGR